MIEQDLITGGRFLGVVSMLVLSALLTLVNRGKVQSQVYNRSRWMLAVACFLLAVHLFVQFIGHFREQSTTLSWTINMLFYIVIIPLYFLADCNLLRAGHIRKQVIKSALSSVIYYTILGVGYLTDSIINDQSPWMTANFIVAALIFLGIIEMSFSANRDIENVRAKLSVTELSDHHRMLLHSACSLRVLLYLSFFAPWHGIFSSLVINSIYCVLIIVAIIWHVAVFILYGENMNEVIAVDDEIYEASAIEAESKKVQKPQTTPDDLKYVVDKWLAQRYFTDPNITIKDVLKQLGFSATMLNSYIIQFTPVHNYRHWLPYLRIEEAKRIMCEHPEYKYDKIARMVGLSNASSFARTFKAQENMTPSQWLNNLKN